MESVNYTMDNDMFERGTNAKSTQGVPMESFLRLASIENARKEKIDKTKTWIRRNKHVIKLKSIMNRDVRVRSPSPTASDSGGSRTSALDYQTL
jgi:hypothetical protein